MLIDELAVASWLVAQDIIYSLWYHAALYLTVVDRNSLIKVAVTITCICSLYMCLSFIRISENEAMTIEVQEMFISEGILDLLDHAGVSLAAVYLAIYWNIFS